MSFSTVMDAAATSGEELSARLVSSGGREIRLAVRRWHSEPGGEEQRVLDRAISPVLDIGCGPARHTLALMERGLDTLGIDCCSASVQLASSRGARVLMRSVFGSVPREGRWATALLLDGNVGIGGEPERLLERTRELLRTNGRVLVEVEPPEEPTLSLLVRLDVRGRLTDPFPWAQVGASDVASIAGRTGFDLAEVWADSGRWFARLDAR